jgi:hypothetical protein
MRSLVELLAVLGRINPAIWDWIVPMGPIQRMSKAAQVELNPQPIPPGHELLVASAMVANQIAEAAIAAQAMGVKNGASLVLRAVDDWCGTGRPQLPIPWPRPWPFPWAPLPGPGPDPGPDPDIAASRVVGALTLASVASRLADGPTRDALSKGAEQLLEVGLSA